MRATALADRAALVAWARDTIAAGSQSFSAASRLFDRATREHAWLLYSWCRTADDMTDGQVLGHGVKAGTDAAAAQAELETRTEAALAGKAPASPAFAALRLVVDETGIPRSLIADHLAGFALDAQSWRPAGEGDLLRYCYHVAGSVGCMMAVVMGVDPADDDTLDRASDLGIAFQLANIARDIVPDAKAGRCYLPQAWLAEYGLVGPAIPAPENRHALAGLAQRLVELASAYRMSARVGAARLSLRSRFAILSADAIYGAIGEKVVALGPTAWDKRVHVGRPEKLMLMTQAAGRCLASPAKVSRAGLWTRPRHPLS
jgi:15-cis-phytoene synthase